MIRRFITVALLVAISCAVVSHAIPEFASTIRPPSYPLAVRTPYASIWLPADTLPGYWPTFWTGTPKGWLGLIRVDGVTYEWMGAASMQSGSPIQMRATQTASYITPTQTIFLLTAGPVNLNVTFFSPVEYEDISRQVIPLSYVLVTAAPNDGQSHSVQVYMDITGEWASSELAAVVTWNLTQSASGYLKGWRTQRQTEDKFGEWGDYAQWGHAVFVTTADATHASGSDVDVRASFVTDGMLDGSNDQNFRCASCDWPTFAVVHDLGQISGTSRTLQYVVGHIFEDNINLLGVAQKSLWTYYYSSEDAMIEFFFNDTAVALARADELDTKVLRDAYLAQGQDYADIVALSLRQAFGANEWSGNTTHPLLYNKEISSGAFMQTVDVIYPATPVFYYLNVRYIEWQLEPLWYFMETPGLWEEDFAMHDIGDLFPNALGQGYGGDMPVEESANMLYMVGNLVFHPTFPFSEAVAYVNKHFTTMAKWANYLYFNCLYPVNQLTTDDFIGHTQLNSGLALKGILAMKTFARMAQLVGNTNATNFYNAAVDSYMQTWYQESLHVDGDHLKMEYNVTNGYQFKYNAFQDRLLNLGVVPNNVYAMEASYYLRQEETYGIPFVNIRDYTKSDWEVWTAAAFGHVNPLLRNNIIRDMARFLRQTPSRVPFTDWYVTASGVQSGFQARPVVGGHFAILALLSNQ